MSKRKNDLSGLIKDLSRTKRTGQNMIRALSPTDLVSQESGSAERLSRIRSSGDTQRDSISGKGAPEGIKFGRPSRSDSKASLSSGSEWTTLLKQTSSGGIASALSGGLAGIGGIGSLISGIFNLFGGGSGKKTPAPLVEFQLPNSQEQTLYVSSKGSSVYQGSATQSGSPSTGGGVYGNAGHMQTSGQPPNPEWIQEQSSQIAQAVKNALLNSSSLNDVIAEI